MEIEPAQPFNVFNEAVQNAIRTLGVLISVGQAREIIRDAWAGGETIAVAIDRAVEFGQRARRRFDEYRRGEGEQQGEPSAPRGPGKRKRDEMAPKRLFWEDLTSYVQLEEKKDVNGKKIKKDTRRKYLLDSLVQATRYRFGRIQDSNALNGVYWLTNTNLDDNWRRLPVYIIPLFTVNQGGAAVGAADTAMTPDVTYGMYELMIVKDAPADATLQPGQMQWRRVPGYNPTLSAATNAYGPVAVTPSDQVDPVIGRKGLLDWTRLKLCFWGKRKAPSRIKVSIMKFRDPNYCPEEFVDRGGNGGTTSGTSNLTPDGCALWADRLKTLLNGGMAGYGRISDTNVINTLKEYNIDINPIDAGAEGSADLRGHMKHLDLFNRWNRVMDFTVPMVNLVPEEPAKAYSGLPVLETYGDIRVQNKLPTINEGFSAYLNRSDDMVYALIESIQEVEEAETTNTDPRGQPTGISPAHTDTAVSFDFTLESSYSHIQGQT